LAARESGRVRSVDADDELLEGAVEIAMTAARLAARRFAEEAQPVLKATAAR